MKLVQAFMFQGYELYIDNFYSSPQLFQDLQRIDIRATGTVNMTRKRLPDKVKELHSALSRSDVPRGTGYYYRMRGSPLVYVSWRDSKCITVMSTAHSGAADGTVKRRVKHARGVSTTVTVSQPSAIKQYNKFMGGVDKSDQYISYHRVLRQTKRYWKTLFYHLVEIAVTNAFLLHQWDRMAMRARRITESTFRDNLVMELVNQVRHSDEDDEDDCHEGNDDDQDSDDGGQDRDDGGQDRDDTDTDRRTDDAGAQFTILHGSRPYLKQLRCAVCHSKTHRKCPDCPNQPSLCQTVKKDCHTLWHSPQSAELRTRWFHQARPQLPLKRRGRPKGRRNKKCRGFVRLNNTNT